MTTKITPYRDGFEPKHAAPRPARIRATRSPSPYLNMVIVGLALLVLVVVDGNTRRPALRDLRSRWRMSRPQTAADADREASDATLWFSAIHGAEHPLAHRGKNRRPAPPIARLRTSTLVVGWIAEQARPDRYVVPDLVTWFRLWCLSEGIA